MAQGGFGLRKNRFGLAKGRQQAVMVEMLGENAISPAVKIRGRVCISILLTCITYLILAKDAHSTAAQV